MRKATLVCAALALLSGAVDATDYVWTGASGPWTTAGNWTPTGVPTTGDTAYVASVTPTAAGNVQVGSVRFNGTGLNIGANTFIAINDNGQNGNFIWRSNSGITAGAIEAYGNVLIQQISSGNPTPSWTMRLKGNNQTFRDVLYRAGYNVEVYGTGAIDNGCFQLYDNKTKFTVRGSGRLGDTASTGQGWSSSEFVFESGQANLPTWGAAVNFTYYGNFGADNGLRKYAINSSVLYPNHVGIGFGFIGNTKKNGMTWRLKGGDLTIARDFNVGAPGVVNYSGPIVLDGDLKFISQENDLSTWRNVTVGRDFVIGGAPNAPSASSPDCIAIAVAKFGNSVIRVGQDLKFGQRSDGSYQPTGSGDLGNATIYVGRNFFIQDPNNKVPNYTRTLSAWSGGASTVICDGNGTTVAFGRKDQTVATYGLKGFRLNNLIIRNECGTVSLAVNDPYTAVADPLAGPLVLTGNLRLEKGKFNDNDRSITFNGPNHTLFWDNNLCKVTGTTPNALDNIILLPDAVLYLDAGTHSIIKVDNLDMQAGSKLYLNGFTLVAEGSTFMSDQVSAGGEAYTAFGSNGMIYGTLAIPEPATLLLLGTGALGVLGYVRRKRLG